MVKQAVDKVVGGLQGLMPRSESSPPIRASLPNLQAAMQSAASADTISSATPSIVNCSHAQADSRITSSSTSLPSLSSTDLISPDIPFPTNVQLSSLSAEVVPPSNTASHSPSDSADVSVLPTPSKETPGSFYRHIFDMAYLNKEPRELKHLREVLDTVLCLREPLSVTSIATLLHSNTHDVRSRLGCFQSVLDVPPSDDDPVRIFHTSFPDYVMDEEQSDVYALDVAPRHLELTLICMRHMNRVLKRNMCNMASRHTHNPDVTTEAVMIREHIPSELQYACVFWTSHLERANISVGLHEIEEELVMFVNKHLLHWLECLSLIQKLDIAVECLWKTMALVSARRITSGVSLYASYIPKGIRTDSLCQQHDHMVQVLNDARRMVDQSYNFMSAYALEVYHSALAWLPRQCVLKEVYPVEGVPHIIAGLDEDWDAKEQVLRHTDDVYAVAFSPDGSQIVSGSVDCTLQIWSMATGKTEKMLKGHSDWVLSVAFSPDGSQIVSGSGDRTVRIWSVATGKTEKTLKGHSGWVLSVAFSPDGSQIVSGSEDCTIRIWSVATGKTENTVKGHSDSVKSVAFSPDGSQIVSGSEDRTVRIWSMVTGKTEKMLKGHSDSVRSVAFSPDGSQIVSGSVDRTVQIWSVATGKTEKTLKGHSDWVLSVAFSPDGSQIVSGSGDRTVRIWSVVTGKTEKTLKGHSGWVRSVTFSPDGSQIVSGSKDHTVRIWSMVTGKTEKTPKGHSSWVTSVAFSPDGSQIVSGSEDHTIRIWSVATGEAISSLRWASEPAILADNSQVVCTAPGCFTVAGATAITNHTLSGTNDCIMLKGIPYLWIWPEYRDINGNLCVFRAGVAALGHDSGRVTIIKL